MPGKRARPFVRTSSRPQLLQSCGYDSPPLSPVGVKYAMGAPQRVVVGFDVVGGAESNTKPSLDTCESPRSVLEPDALSDHHYHHRPSALSPRSALDRLLSGPESRPSCKAGVGLGIIAAIRQEELAVRKTTLGISCRGNPINAISERISGVDPQNCTFKDGRPSNAASNHVNASSDVDFSDGEEDDDDHLAADMQGSIFCTASPFSNRCSLDTLAGDFLSVCFFCKSRLMMGKDIFMYRGDRAFCSSECRYQPIVIDELKERQPAETNCYHVRPLMC